MKILKALSIFISIFLIFSCSEKILTPTYNDSGSLVLKIDKQNTPSNVVVVRTYLTRENYKPIIDSLNLLSDSTAELLINNVSAGNWHLKVDAEDDSSLILYAGETVVEVYAGVTNQVYLTLIPTGAGVGSIYINVTWGIPISLNWIDYNNNPILVSQAGYYDDNGIAQPVVIYDEGKYKMWFNGLAYGGGSKSYIFYAESLDGNNWNLVSNNPVLFPSFNGAWDSQHVSPGAVVKENGIYKMYYCGFSDTYNNWNVGYATSADGINWEKYPQPILYGTNGWEYQIVVSAVVKLNDQYLMYYTGRNYPYYSVGLAISNDGINWIKYNNNPILKSEFTWESTGVLDASVVKVNNQLKMVYMSAESSGFGFATSNDGINWTKSTDNPFFKNTNTSNNWANYKVSYPSYLITPTKERIFYSGLNYNTSVSSIGFVEKVQN